MRGDNRGEALVDREPRRPLWRLVLLVGSLLVHTGVDRPAGRVTDLVKVVDYPPLDEAEWVLGLEVEAARHAA